MNFDNIGYEILDENGNHVGFIEKDGTFEFDGIKYKIRKI
jgi:hypothetical protein